MVLHCNGGAVLCVPGQLTNPPLAAFAAAADSPGRGVRGVLRITDESTTEKIQLECLGKLPEERGKLEGVETTPIRVSMLPWREY
jgi:hypothetical protein